MGYVCLVEDRAGFLEQCCGLVLLGEGGCHSFLVAFPDLGSLATFLYLK